MTRDAGRYAFSTQERLVFGQPAGDAVRAEAERRGATRVFLTASRSLAKLADGPLQRLERALGDRHAGTFSRFSAHTPVEDVLDAVAHARSAKADLLVAVGGGSVIDGSKAMRPGLGAGGDVATLDALAAVLQGDGTVPDWSPADLPVDLIAVPTTLSAAEFTTSAGVSVRDPKTGVLAKRGLRHRLLAPACVVLDAAATLDTPLPLLLATGLRAVDHAIESFLSPEANAATQVHSLQGLRWLHGALPLIHDAPDDRAARTRAQLGAWQAITGSLTGAGSGASHGIGYALGASFGVAHGHTSCVLLPPVLVWNAAQDAAAQEPLREAMGLPAGVSAALGVARLVRRLGLPGSLPEVGLTREQLPELARRALTYDKVTNNVRPVRTVEAVGEILETAWQGLVP